MKFRVNDQVMITGGKDKGKTGIIKRVYVKSSKVIVPEINVYKKHIKRTENTPQGGIVAIERPLTVANIAIICPKCKKNTRIGYKKEGDKKLRICRKCEAVI